MSNRTDDFRLLEHRGAHRSADAILEAVSMELDRARVFDRASESGDPIPNQAVSRRTISTLAAVAAFVLVMAVGATVVLLPLGDDPTTQPQTNINTSPVPDPTANTSEVPETPNVVDLAGAKLVPLETTATPAVATVLGLPQCAEAQTIADQELTAHYPTLQIDPATGLQLVGLNTVAETMPVPRSGSFSLVSPEVLDGACTVGASNDEFLGWVLVSSSGQTLMTAGSVPWPDNSVPDFVSTFPGDYQQWRVATGQLFTGPVSDDGQFLVATLAWKGTGWANAASRIMAGFVDPGLVPENARLAGWTMASLAMSRVDYLFARDDIARDETVPTAVPEGYGVCGSVPMFLMFSDIDEAQEEFTTTILCNAEGQEITTTGTRFDESRTIGSSLDVNGRAAYVTTTDDKVSLYLDGRRSPTGPGTAVRLDGDSDLGETVLAAVLSTVPLASPPPGPTDTVVAAIGVGDGLDLSQATDENFEIHIPTVPSDGEPMTLTDMIAAGDYISVEALSDSMQAIAAAALSDHDSRPLTYQFRGYTGGEWNSESATFDLPGFEARVSLGQQLLPSGDRNGSTISAIETTQGAWIISDDTRETPAGLDVRGLERIQIIAYAPSIQRQVNVTFGVRNYLDGPDARPLGLTVAQAHEIVGRVLDAIAPPA